MERPDLDNIRDMSKMHKIKHVPTIFNLCAYIDYLESQLTQKDEEIRKLHKIQDRVNKGEVWYWQGDGYDFPESLICPVIMDPENLRAILTPDKINAEIQEKNHEELESIQESYYELIMAVATKYPGENRHETALRYIKEAENKKLTASQERNKQ